jgi:hypothetical protein
MLQNFFQHNYVSIEVISIKIIGKYIASAIYYAKKVIGHWGHSHNTSLSV